MDSDPVCFRFYAELNDLLPPERRGRPFWLALDRRASAKDAIEALGVPHTEVDLLLVNGESVGFGHSLHPGDRVSVYPVFESLDISPLLRVRPRPLREARFVLDAHLGKLASLLRLEGLDALYRNDYDDDTLARISHDERRILLTRDRGLLKRNTVTHGYLVRSEVPRRQLVEVLRRFDLARAVQPFTRCPRCNAPLAPAPKERLVRRLQPRTRLYYDAFYVCQGCGQVYWRGSHYEQLRRLLDEALAEAGTSGEVPPTGEDRGERG